MRAQQLAGKLPATARCSEGARPLLQEASMLWILRSQLACHCSKALRCAWNRLVKSKIGGNCHVLPRGLLACSIDCCQTVTPRKVHWACLAAEFSSESHILGPAAVCEPDGCACIWRDILSSVCWGNIVSRMASLRPSPTCCRSCRTRQGSAGWLAFWQGLKEGQLRMGVVRRLIL